MPIQFLTIDASMESLNSRVVNLTVLSSLEPPCKCVCSSVDVRVLFPSRHIYGLIAIVLIVIDGNLKSSCTNLN